MLLLCRSTWRLCNNLSFLSGYLWYTNICTMSCVYSVLSFSFRDYSVVLREVVPCLTPSGAVVWRRFFFALVHDFSLMLEFQPSFYVLVVAAEQHKVC